jgi:hypothetical protein
MINDNIEDNINNIIHELIDKVEYNELWEGDDSNNSILCAICFEIIKKKNNCITSCGHKFCLSCILISAEYNNTCPCCREKLYSKYNYLENLETNNEDSEEDGEDDNNIQMQQLLLNTTNNQQMTEEQITLFIRLKNILEFSERFSYILTTLKNGCIRTTKFVSFIILTSFGIHVGIQLSNYFLYNVCKIEYENVRSNVYYNNNSY